MLPPIPDELKSISTYLQRGQELAERDPIVSYYCNFYAAKKAIELADKRKESQGFLMALLDSLEAQKKAIGPNEALTNDIVGFAHVENFALKVFVSADNQDRAGHATKATAKTFLAASIFLEVLKTFQSDDESLAEVNQKIKYAKFKATDIIKALNQGTVPTPGPPGESPLPPDDSLPLDHVDAPVNAVNSTSEGTSSIFFPSPPTDLPAIVTFIPPSTPSHPAPIPQGTTSIPQGNISQKIIPTMSTIPPALMSQDHQKCVQQAQKNAKFAISALQYDDVPTAIDQLQKALELMEQSEHGPAKKSMISSLSTYLVSLVYHTDIPLAPDVDQGPVETPVEPTLEIENTPLGDTEMVDIQTEKDEVQITFEMPKPKARNHPIPPEWTARSPRSISSSPGPGSLPRFGSPTSGRSSPNREPTRRTLSLLQSMDENRSQSSRQKLMSHYIPDYSATVRAGYTGSQEELQELVAYKKSVEELQAKRTNILASYSPELPKVTQLGKEVEWMKMIQERILNAIKPRPLVPPTTVQTPVFDSIVELEKSIDKQVQDLKKPKELFPPLSIEAKKLVANAMKSHDKEFSKKFNITITSRTIQLLKPSVWLNDEIISFYAGMLMERSQNHPELPKIYIFSTYFHSDLSRKGYPGVRRWTRKFDIFAFDHVIIPVHLGLHWVCARINFKDKRLEYYDSLHGSNPECLSNLKHYLEQESLDKKQTPFDFTGWQNYAPTDSSCPAQKNGVDCGVFTIMFMEFLSRDAKLEFKQEHMPYLRLRIAHDILTCTLMQ